MKVDVVSGKARKLIIVLLSLTLILGITTVAPAAQDDVFTYSEYTDYFLKMTLSAMLYLSRGSKFRDFPLIGRRDYFYLWNYWCGSFHSHNYNG